MHRVDRVLERLEELAAMGDGSVTRRRGRRAALPAGGMEDAGLDVSVDDAGNLVGASAAGSDPWTGSHLATVPNGGGSTVLSGSWPGWKPWSAPAGAPRVFRDEERGVQGEPRLHGTAGSVSGAPHRARAVCSGRDAPLAVVTRSQGSRAASSCSRGVRATGHRADGCPERRPRRGVRARPPDP